MKGTFYLNKEGVIEGADDRSALSAPLGSRLRKELGEALGSTFGDALGSVLSC
jgi:hypothetical protein